MPFDDLFGAPMRVRDLSIERGAEFSPCGRYRYTLTRRWGDGPTGLAIGCNPSLADGMRDDPTILRETHFFRAWGYGGFVKVNFYPVITPDMRACNEWLASLVTNPAASAALMTNVCRILQEARKADMVLAAWGAIVVDEEWVEIMVAAITKAIAPLPLYCLGTTESGAPKHPMARGLHRVPDDQQPLLWRAAALQPAVMGEVA